MNIATQTNVCHGHCSHVATDLTELTKKGAKFKWTPYCQAAFDNP